MLDIGEETSRATDSHFVLHRKERENRSSEIISKWRESLHRKIVFQWLPPWMNKYLPTMKRKNKI